LLALLPFWDPQIPPPGLACLKSFLQPRGYDIKTVDANTIDALDETYHHYFEVLKAHIPGNRQGHFYKIGHDVLRHHMMAYLLRRDKDDETYLKLIPLLIYQTFYYHVPGSVIEQLDLILSRFYDRFKSYFLDLLAKEMPDVLGLSVFEGTLAASLYAFQLARRHYPHIQTVMGGGVFTNQLEEGSADLERFLKKTTGIIDKVIIGEGELLFLKYLQGNLPGSQRVYTLDNLNRETLDLSQLDIPDFSDFNLGPYPYLTTYGSRSCPFQCKFCSEARYWGKFRMKDAAQIAKQLSQLHEKYRTQIFLLGDSLLNPFISNLARELLKQEVSLYWDGFLRVAPSVGLRENTLLWRQGGFYRARLGVESGSDRILDLMNKGITAQQIKDSLSALAQVGIKTTTYWVIGFPGETEADFQQTLDLIEELRDDIYQADCTPFSFSMAGQQSAVHWEYKPVLLYPEEAGDILLIPTWILDCQPSREETYQRMWRFVQHCSRLGIPNPYFFNEIYQADERWKGLHPNAVPSLAAFKNKGSYINDKKQIKAITFAHQPAMDDGDFGF
jgi:radical SAM superfamily enzyme YgiQ (UPF0313 family)